MRRRRRMRLRERGELFDRPLTDKAPPVEGLARTKKMTAVVGKCC